ncbi:RING-7 protein [Histoplasma capsulatum var. duboisii H88]|uniref:RING-7 protein n=1 Tax=Ajellomyces capsulatus (strain H88) TaxID=544711 RepID=F0UHD0_AJEC8|nr:RING-7 protein [Histoplasma capsulatum var. duboisii H88]
MRILSSSIAETVMLALLSICAFALLSAPVQAQTSQPSNDSQDLQKLAPNSNYHLHTGLTSLDPIQLAPLTRPLINLDFNTTGTLVIIDSNNATALNGTDIALISCDASSYSGGAKPDSILQSAITGRPRAIVLYTTEFSHCNYSTKDGERPRYHPIFTTTNPLAVRDVIASLRSGQQSLEDATIAPDMDVRQFTSADEGNQRNNVAMIILYSITGIITSLFLIVIVTGAIRAHLNPDRYGPRNTAGRPRQSRAKGIARAMLETLPIVKFGDPEDDKSPAAKQDLELASNYADADHDRRSHDERADGVTTPDTRQLDHPQPQQKPVESEQQQQQQQTAQISAAASASYVQINKELEQEEAGVIGPAALEPNPVSPEHSTDGGALGCPICTDDFVKGQDVRLLPCKHKFHPECVDPWLINVSGTCPLCRVNLNTQEPDTDSDDTATPASTSRASTPTSQPAAQQPNHPHHHQSRRLDMLRRMQRSSEPHQANSSSSGSNIHTIPVSEPPSSSMVLSQGQPDEASRRHRLSAWLRERFRVRTRRHGDDEDDEDDGEDDGDGHGHSNGSATRTNSGAGASASPNSPAHADGHTEPAADTAILTTTTTTTTTTTRSTTPPQQTTINPAPPELCDKSPR